MSRQQDLNVCEHVNSTGFGFLSESNDRGRRMFRSTSRHDVAHTSLHLINKFHSNESEVVRCSENSL